MTKANMSLTRNPMPTQDAKLRAHNFDEVALGYSEETAINEAMRCLECKNMPCVDGCPVKIHIPEFISAIKEGDFERAYQIISKSSSLPAVLLFFMLFFTQISQRDVIIFQKRRH